MTVKPHTTAANDRTPADLAAAPARDPLLVGAAAIAAHLDISERQVYAMREAGGPIGRVPGIGIAVRISRLSAYLEEKGS